MTSNDEVVLVTGGAGYIGSHVVLALRDAGRACVVLDDLSAGHAEVVPADVPLVRGNVGDRACLGALFRDHRIGAAIHLAGSVLVAESVAEPLRYYDNNTVATHRFLEECGAAGVRHVVFSSTAAVYGAPTATPIGEAEPKAPINPYGRSKLAVEWMLEDAAHAGMLDYVALRYFNVAGADAALRSGEWRARASHLVNVACEAALGLRDAFTIYGTDYPTADGTCVRDFIHVSDLAAAHLAALDHLAAGGGSIAVNCGDGRGASVREVLDTVRAVSGVPIGAVEGPRRDGDPPALVADPALANTLLGWRARLGIEDMVASALRWERKRRGMPERETDE